MVATSEPLTSGAANPARTVAAFDGGDWRHTVAGTGGAVAAFASGTVEPLTGGARSPESLTGRARLPAYRRGKCKRGKA